jgi:hypothetical protein
MINYDELKTALTDISNICRMTDCDLCPFLNDNGCKLHYYTANNWMDELSINDMQQFADRGAHLVEEGYIDE